jgi:hypothetical protein
VVEDGHDHLLFPNAATFLMNSEKSDRLARSWANEHGAPALTSTRFRLTPT